MSVISDVSVNCNGLHSAEISQAWQFKSIYCFTDRSPPFNPPKLLDPCAIYCAGRPHTTNKILTWKRSVDLELNWPTRVWSSIHSDIQEKWIGYSDKVIQRAVWNTLEEIGRHCLSTSHNCQSWGLTWVWNTTESLMCLELLSCDRQRPLTHSPIDNRAGKARAAKKYMIPDLGRGKRRCAWQMIASFEHWESKGGSGDALVHTTM